VSQAWWFMPVIPALGTLRQKDLSLRHNETLSKKYKRKKDETDKR
jgi:hypothetical protein